MAAEKLQVILELAAGQYKREAREAASATDQIGKAASTASSPIGGLGERVGGLGASLSRFLGPAALGGMIVGLGNMAIAAGENADRLFDLEAQTGLTTDKLQEYEHVAKIAGASQEVFADAVKAVIKNLSEVEAGTGPAAKAYETLGVNVLDASGNLRDAGTITDEVFSKLAGMENITARNALAQDIFGKKWEETISVLDLGADAISTLKDEAHELGVVIEKESLVAADRLRENFEKLKTVVSAQVTKAIIGVGTNIAAWFGDEASKDLVVYSEALTRIKRRMDEGVPSWSAFSEALFRVADKSDVTAEELVDLADSAGIAIESMSDEGFQLFVDTLLDQAIAAELDEEAIDDLKTALMEATPEQLAMLSAISETNDEMDDAVKLSEDAQTAALKLRDANREAAKSFRRDLTNAINGFVTFFDGAVDEIETSLAELETQFEKRTSQNERFWNGLVVLAAAGLDDLVEELREQGPEAAGVVEELVNNMDRAFDWERRIEETKRQAVAMANALANGLEGETDTIGAAFNRFGISLADQLEAGFSTADLSNTLIELMDIADSFGGAITTPGGGRGIQQFATGGVVRGRLGSPQLIMAHAGETVIPAQSSLPINGMVSGGSTTYVGGSTIVVQSPMNEFRSDLQYATILASLTNLVEGN